MKTQRERFEAWASAPGREYPLARTDHGNYKSHQVESMWAGYQAACPEGWQAIPVDPTAGMLRSLWLEDPFGRYPALLAAAPKPEDVNNYEE